jgi:ferredoxin-NADP reductase
VLFRDELEGLAENLDLQVEQVVGDAHPEWNGQPGMIDEAVLERCVPTDRSTWEYFVCGPGPMMDVAEPWLLAKGVPMRRVNSERFNIA